MWQTQLKDVWFLWMMIPCLILMSASIASAPSLALLFVLMWFMIEKPRSHSEDPTGIHKTFAG